MKKFLETLFWASFLVAVCNILAVWFVSRMMVRHGELTPIPGQVNADLALPTPVSFRDEAGRACVMSFAGGVDCDPPTPSNSEDSATPWPTFIPIPSETVAPALPPASATPTALPATLTRSPTAALPTSASLLPQVQNGSFEQGLASWGVFVTSRDGSIPELNSEYISAGADPVIVKEGNASLRLQGNYRCYSAGVYQVMSAGAGARFRAEGWGGFYASSLPWNAHDPNVYGAVMIGIDPQGFTDPASSGVRWGKPSYRAQGLALTAVEAQAVSNRVTVFVRAVLGEHPAGGCYWPLHFMLAFIDAVTVSEVP